MGRVNDSFQHTFIPIDYRKETQTDEKESGQGGVE